MRRDLKGGASGFWNGISIQTILRGLFHLHNFPVDFIFRLTKNEFTEVVTNCDYLQNLKFRPTLPYVFTEQGVAMLAAVLNSQKAIDVNIQIMRIPIYLNTKCGNT